MKKSNINKEENKWDGFSVIVKTKVRWRDLDAYGHINNAVFLTYFEEGRIEYFSKFQEFIDGMKNPKAKNAIASVLVKASVSYRAPGHINDHLIIAIRIKSIKKSFFESEYEIYNEKTKVLLTKGTTLNIIVDTEKMKPMKMPDSLKQKIIAIEGEQVLK